MALNTIDWVDPGMLGEVVGGGVIGHFKSQCVIKYLAG